jgi:hypothetical protein
VEPEVYWRGGELRKIELAAVAAMALLVEKAIGELDLNARSGSAADMAESMNRQELAEEEVEIVDVEVVTKLYSSFGRLAGGQTYALDAI